MADDAGHGRRKAETSLPSLTPTQRKALASLLRGADGYVSADAPRLTRDDLHDRELDRLGLDQPGE